MGSAVPFAFFSGLHLALLQFGYLFLLLIRISSTPVSYAAVALSWTTGALAGLWWRRLNPEAAVIAGVISYYCAVAIALAQPAGAHVWPATAVAVGISGLWAGRLLVVLLPSMRRATRLFFHVGNGLAIGIVGSFAGVSMLGERFLLWVPLLSGMVLLALRTRVEAARPLAAPARATRVPAAEPDLAVRPVSPRAIGMLAILACALNCVLPLGLLAYAAWMQESPWRMFLGEDNLITWFSTGQLLLISAIAYLNYEALSGLDRPGEIRPRRWIWLLLAFAFAFLAVDEFFKVHETIRNDVLRPRHLFTHVPLLKPGDVVLFFYAGTGIAAAAAFLVGDLRRNPPSLGLFLGAVVLTACTLIVDALDRDIIRQWPMPRFWTSVFEEVGEIWAQLLFLLSFLVVLRRRVVHSHPVGAAGGS